MTYKLEILITFNSNRQRFQIEIKDKQKLTIGRHNCSITLEDARLSRQHLLLSIEEGNLVMRDLESRNGSFFEGQKFEQRNVAIGDEYRVGSHTIKICKLELLSTGQIAVNDSVGFPRRNGPEREASISEIHAKDPVDKDSNFEIPEAPSKSEPDPIEEVAPPPSAPGPILGSTESSSEERPTPSEFGFAFFPYRRFSFKAILDFYKFAFTNIRTFWTSNSYAIPPEEALFALLFVSIFSGIASFVLKVVSTLGTGIVFQLPFLVYTSVSIFVGSLLSASIHTLLRSFVKAQGGFEPYLAFFVYASFIQVPVTCLAAVIPILGAIASLLVFFWVLSGFFQVFQPHKGRYVLACLLVMLLAAVVVGGPLLLLLFKGASASGTVPAANPLSPPANLTP